MQAARCHEMLRTQSFRPFLVKTTDGDTFRVDHPDYAMVSPGNHDLAIFDKDDHFRLVAIDHIVTLEPVREAGRKSVKR